MLNIKSEVKTVKVFKTKNTEMKCERVRLSADNRKADHIYRKLSPFHPFELSTSVMEHARFGNL